VIAVDLLIESLGIEGLRRTGNTGEDQHGNKRGCDRLHGYLSSGVRKIRYRAGDTVLPYVGWSGCYGGNKGGQICWPQHGPCRAGAIGSQGDCCRHYLSPSTVSRAAERMRRGSHAPIDRAIRLALPPASFGVKALRPAGRRESLASIAHDRIGRPTKRVRMCVDCFTRVVLSFRALQHGQH
jgi:hypothetical protein